MLEAVISFNSPIQMAFDNVSLVLMEIISYFCILMACIHANGSPKRTQLILGALGLYNTISLGLGQLDTQLAITWHSQGMIMLFYNHVPLYLIALQSALQYLAYISTLKLRLHFFASVVCMGLLYLAVVFPAELLGSKLVWWTWHDTDPSLVDRVFNMPISVLVSNVFSASSFFLCVELLRHRYTPGFVFQPSLSHTEYYTMLAAIIASFPASFLLFVLSYELFHSVLGVSSEVILASLLLISCFIVWSSDRHGGQNDVSSFVPWQFDGEWHHNWYDHALIQSLFLYLLLTPIILLVVNPSNLVSLGYHQTIGDCSHVTTFKTIFGKEQKRYTYLCHLHFEEAYSFCGAPRSQLHINDPWYKICGVAYGNPSFANYLVILLAVNGCLVGVFREIFRVTRPMWAARFAAKPAPQPPVNMLKGKE